MRFTRFGSFIFCCGALVACATPGSSTFNYAAPELNAKIDNSIVAPEDFETVWDRLVGRLATSFFVINNIDKASRLINISFSSDGPEEYVDCGESSRTYEFKGDSQSYRYKVAQDSTYKRSGSWGPMNNLPWVQDIFRDASLDGRINVYVAPLASQGTQVSVNAKYILEVVASGTTYAYNAYGTLVNQQPVSLSLTVDFTTNQIKTKNWDSGAAIDDLTCSATGALERALLEMAQR